MARARLAALVLTGATLLAAEVSAHTRGLSRSTFDVTADGTVHAKLQLAAADLPAEARASQPALAELGARGVDVRADGASCPARCVGSAPDGPDGVAIELDFACPRDASVIEAELFLLSDLAASSQDVATLTAGAKTRQSVLDAAHRSIQLEVAPKKRGTSPALVAWVIGATLVAGIAMWLVAARRRR